LCGFGCLCFSQSVGDVWLLVFLVWVGVGGVLGLGFFFFVFFFLLGVWWVLVFFGFFCRFWGESWSGVLFFFFCGLCAFWVNFM